MDRVVLKLVAVETTVPKDTATAEKTTMIWQALLVERLVLSDCQRPDQECASTSLKVHSKEHEKMHKNVNVNVEELTINQKSCMRGTRSTVSGDGVDHH